MLWKHVSNKSAQAVTGLVFMQSVRLFLGQNAVVHTAAITNRPEANPFFSIFFPVFPILHAKNSFFKDYSQHNYLKMSILPHKMFLHLIQ